MPPREDRVPVTTWVPMWVKEGLRREAYENRQTVSAALVDWLIDSCSDYPESPKNQPHSAIARPASTPMTVPPSAAEVPR
jgi:hypothetical protein